MSIIEIQKEIKNHFQNFIDSPDSNFLKEAFDYLKSRSELIGIEYRFLCWLEIQFGYENKLELPKLIHSIEDFNYLDFEKHFVNSESRKRLFQELKQFVTSLKNRQNLQELSVLIGGSFTDSQIKLPNDIDSSILIPSGLEDDLNFNEIYLYTCNEIPKGIDLIFLPESMNLNSFKVFSRLMCLGNKAEHKDKDDKSYLCNSFEERKVVRLKL